MAKDPYYRVRDRVGTMKKVQLQQEVLRLTTVESTLTRKVQYLMDRLEEAREALRRERSPYKEADAPRP